MRSQKKATLNISVRNNGNQ